MAATVLDPDQYSSIRPCHRRIDDIADSGGLGVSLSSFHSATRCEIDQTQTPVTDQQELLVPVAVASLIRGRYLVAE